MIPRVSMRASLFVVFLIAANCAASRLVFGGHARQGLVFGLFGIWPMANVLAVACYRGLSSGRVGRPFFLGFGLCGALAIIGWLNFCLLADEAVFLGFSIWMAQTLEGLPFVLAFVAWCPYPAVAMALGAVLTVAFCCLLTAVPQMLLALCGGWVAERLSRRLFRGLAG
jgi:hypothetical protein